METTCALNTLVYDADLCVGCNMCSIVCPHGVFSPAEPVRPGSKQLKARLLHPEDCMECGACALNCLTNAIRVESGVGCASAMIYAALTGKEVSCGGSGCCGPSPATGKDGCSATSGPKNTACCSSPEPQKAGCCSPSEDKSCGGSMGSATKTPNKANC